MTTPQLKKQIYFAIPAYNEGRAVLNVIKKLHSFGYYNLILVNDGSTDNTHDILSSVKRIHYLQHPINLGQGAALQTAITYALSQKNCTYIVTFDSDGQHRIEDLERMLKPLEANACDIVLGSRFLQSDTRHLVPLKKQILLFGGRIITYLISSIWLTDTHNGYRVMNRRAASRIHITMDGFEHASEIIDTIARKKIRFVEVPVYIDYTDYAKEKGQRMSNSLRILAKMLLRKIA